MKWLVVAACAVLAACGTTALRTNRATGGTGGAGLCERQADCYPDHAFCNDASVCEPLADTLSACGNPGVPELEAPMLIVIQQLDEPGPGRCAKDPINCPNDGNVCWFRLTAWDPNADWPVDALFSHTRFVRGGDGQVVVPFAARNAIADGQFFDFEVASCFEAGVSTSSGGFVLLDAANRRSNLACVSAAGGRTR